MRAITHIIKEGVMTDRWSSQWSWKVSAVVLVGGLVLGNGNGVTQAGERDDTHDSHHHTLASSTMFGGPSQDGALVYIRNVSSKPVTLSDKRVVNEQGNNLPIIFDTCGSSVAPNMTCVFFTEQPHIVGGQAYAASVTVKGAPTSAVRAQFEIRNSFHAPPLGPLARDNMR